MASYFNPASENFVSPLMRQRGYYSDNIVNLQANESKFGAEKDPSISWKILQKDRSILAQTFNEPEYESFYKNQKYGPTTASVHIAEFPPKSWHPKVQIPFKVIQNPINYEYKSKAALVPRKIEIERQKRKFASQDLQILLKDAGINESELMPLKKINMKTKIKNESKEPIYPCFLPLEIFDNTDYDCRTPSDWLALGLEGNIRKPVPGKAFLPKGMTSSNSSEYQWVNVGMVDYNFETQLYSIIEKPEEKELKDIYLVPRIRLMFFAEDPHIFVQRIKNAYEERKRVENLIRYQLYIDCMPTEGVAAIELYSLRKIVEWAKRGGTVSEKLAMCLEKLCKEVRLDYQRSMNKIIFDNNLKKKKNPFVFLEEKCAERIHFHGYYEDVLPANFDNNFKNFAFKSLMILPEVIEAFSKVKVECNKVMALSLFQIPLNKAIRLEEFDNMQSQMTLQVCMFLKDSWVSNLRGILRGSLHNVGKGWFNIEETNWEAYKVSKLCKLLEVVKFQMQDCVRYLVQDSLKNYAQLIIDGCCTADVDEGMKWPCSISKSPFLPKKNCLFLIDLVFEENTVTFSTKPEKFQDTVITLFNKAVHGVKKIPQLEKMMLERLFWRGTALIEPVGDGEPLVVYLRNKIRTALKQAVVPLLSYAKEYEKYLGLANLELNSFVSAYSKQEYTAADIRRDVRLHLQEKDDIENQVPQSIVIGPFMVNIDSVKQFLLKKKKQIANSLLELFTKRVYKNVESICEEFKTISRKLFEKPNDIEQVTEMREYLSTLSISLSEKQDLMNKVMLDYDVMEEFCYNISIDDFTTKWSCLAWPGKIQQQIEMTVKNLQVDEDRFHKSLLTEQNLFQDRVDGINMTVAGFSIYNDITKAHEIANEARRVSKQLKECQAQVQLFNKRERLFHLTVTNYEKLAKLNKDFEPFKNLWITVSDWLRYHESWMNDPLTTIDAEFVEKLVNESFRTLQKCIKQFVDIPSCQLIAQEAKTWVENFRPYIPLIQALRNPGMRKRHWEQLSSELNQTVIPKSALTFSKCLEMKFDDHIETISKIGVIAGKEFAIEEALNKMENAWKLMHLEVLPYKETGSYIVKIVDEITQMLDDHIVMTQAMAFSPYKKAFEDRISTWESKLLITQDVLDEWVSCQRAWLYLEPIFSSEDINRQLPVECKRYQTMDRMWKKIMVSAYKNPDVLEFCVDQHLLENLKESNMLLEQVQKGLCDYLETKRTSFPRFYFLSDDELLEILSQTKDPTAVQPHLRKCFENIAKLTFESNLQISEMHSGEGEKVPFCETFFPEGNVEDWLLKVEFIMKKSLKTVFLNALLAYTECKRTDWVLQWPGQIVIAVCQTFWTTEVNLALEKQNVKDCLHQFRIQLTDLVAIVRGDLSPINRLVLGALIVIEVHAVDVVERLLSENVSSINAFEWISQLRYYWEDTILVRAVNAVFEYGYEYLGNNGRLVITPLTDRCYLTLTGALHLYFGGAPAGPAGTGKTETTKDLAKAIAFQCVVFNCSDQLDFLAMGKFLKGLATSGAWACFDEFNRIDIEVLSVVAQQIATIQQAQKQKVDRFLFEGVELSLRSSCAVFITMNPGYAGRTELPDNLKALFRPVAMMVPDYALIAEISLFSFGFNEAKVLAKKITTTFKLSSEQLSAQDHYDFGMRAVKTVISAAGNLKRENPNMSEELICLRAICDVNVPKFLQDDLKLFKGIVSDLFPKIKEQKTDYGCLEESIKLSCHQLNIEDVPGFVVKCMQLFETTVVRHGLMLVGPAGSGKTKCYQTLQKALTSLKGIMSPSGVPFQEVKCFVLNPKSITMGQLYGEFDTMTHEWTDGILSSLVRAGSASISLDKKWYVFDGPVDAVWIENMNTVLDDNKKLCLTSGEIIKLTPSQTMVFEVQDLAVASPATVSRCGMVYLEPSIVGLQPFVNCWLKNIPKIFVPFKEQLHSLFVRFLQPSINFIRKNTREIIPTMDSALAQSLMKFLDCFFATFKLKEGDSLSSGVISLLPSLIEPWFIFSLIWSVGASCDGNGRKMFSAYLRKKMEDEKICILFPSDGLVYDYQLLNGTLIKDENQSDSQKNITEICWVNWMYNETPSLINIESNYSDIVIPTMDLLRGKFIIELLLNNSKKVMCVGPTGCGKTLCVCKCLLIGMPVEYLSNFIIFSARTSANQTQDIIDGKLDKRRKGIYGPPLGKKFILFIDDLNMPALDSYGAQPPIELLRQFCDHKGWYDRKQIGVFRELVDVNVICAMGPPGGGRNHITQRFSRHFNLISFCEMEDESKKTIFSTILRSWLNKTSIEGLIETEKTFLSDLLVDHTLSVYNNITTQLLPTPAKSHYTFNLRDLSKVFQGILMLNPQRIATKMDVLRLWYHENCRVFQDRLVNEEDRKWFNNHLKEHISAGFKINIDEMLTHEPVLYGDFMISNAEIKNYDEITDYVKLQQVLEDYLDDYNQINIPQMKLVLFTDAIQHISRISRIIRQPFGNALLLGVAGSGRQSLTRLAAHMAEYDLFQIELSKSYGIPEWREDIKKLLMKAGIENKPIVFLFADTQIKSEIFLEDINNILNAGDVPNIYSSEELDSIFLSMDSVVQDQGLVPTKANLFMSYTNRVRFNIHIVICMSPIGEVFRARLRQFPSLVTCCTIDWFSEWPEQALVSVAETFISEMAEVDQTSIASLVKLFGKIHQSVLKKSSQYLIELSRHNYVTPTSYLELLKTFKSILSVKKNKIFQAKNRTINGLEKLLSTQIEVTKLQEELETMQPLFIQATLDTEETMRQIAVDTITANETKVVVQKEEQEAAKKAEETKTIADDAQRDLNEAIPALEAALQSLKSLNRNDVVEVRAMQRPPLGVKMVMEAVCIMKGLKPKKVAGEKVGSKVDDYMEAARTLLQDPGKFLDTLFQYDKGNIPDSVIQNIQGYIDDDNFQPEAIAKVSKACTSICQWVRAMHKYHFVAKGVAPKRACLEKAQEELAETQRALNAAKAKLALVEEGVAMLQAKYQECIFNKNELEKKTNLCTARLGRAEKLINGLGDEKGRWEESIVVFDQKIQNILGDILVSSGIIAYLGIFTGEYRNQLINEWIKELELVNVLTSKNFLLVSTLGEPVKVRNWQLCGLPRDNFSVDNGIIVEYTNRWPLFIDPQGQANKWIKNLEKKSGISVVKLSDREFLRTLENSIRFGKPCLLENVGEELDPSLEPVLLKLTFKQSGNMVIKLGDAVIPYHEEFKFYITTKHPNPHYTPEVSTKVTIVNFTLSPSGLEDQLLALVVAEERPDLEEAKNQLIINSAKMKEELKEIEDKILHRLTSSEGSPVDDEALIITLEESKLKSQDIKAKVVIAEQTENSIDAIRSEYIPVAVRSQILFFCTYDLAMIDSMYQYSLDWFIKLFLSGIASAARADTISQRVQNINNFFTFSLYSNVCRSLFEKHKLLFSFLLSIRILMNKGQINLDEWSFFLTGGIGISELLPNPAVEWLSERAWKGILSLRNLPQFSEFFTDFCENLNEFKRVFDSNQPHREVLPLQWENRLDAFQKLLVLRCICADKLTNGMQDFVALHLGQRFIEPQNSDLAQLFKDSSPTTPLIFILSPGTDPAAALYKFAEEMRFLKKMSSISLGQGQGPRAEAMLNAAMERGKWVFFQNCHLAPSWMPSLERMIEGIDPDKVHRDFRMWATSMPSPKFPVAILQNSSKMTVEPPKGIKANLLKSYIGWNDDFLNMCKQNQDYKSLLFSLCLFHGVSLERRRYGPLGFNIPYEFTEGDLQICVSQLGMFLEEYFDVPYKVLKYTAGHINYGGRITDDWDRRCLMTILDNHYNPNVLQPHFKFSPSGIYRQQDLGADHKSYMEYILQLPINDAPEIFGLHENANITFSQNESFRYLSGILQLQPKSLPGLGRSKEEIIEETAINILKQVPDPIDIESVVKKYPVIYEESMNTVLIQEITRYNKLLNAVKQSLKDLIKALKGVVVMSEELEMMSNSLFNNQVPSKWVVKAYPSLKPLASWVIDLTTRINFVKLWIDNGIPSVFWISGFFFPQGFLTGILQNYARSYATSIDTISFDFSVLKLPVSKLTERPRDGCYINGLYLEGARWSFSENELTESRSKELFTEMPVIWLKPCPNRIKPSEGVYECPVYKTLMRAGSLSTTGHSTNFVLQIELPTNRPQSHWIKQGVALMCSLDF
ncbi:dynein axonemal heavy chain 1 isoform X1 [Hydra vulgaris]|uniref:dynein axonemal heavy chain 1 isoform X1 n=1 Tax=Hydra vulgaris TaxID=6087 RepID=UPI0032EA4119